MQIAETFEDLEKRLGKDLYPLYKEKIREPLIRDGYGSKGAMMENKVDGSLMCHNCGKTYQNLGAHTARSHKKTAREYKIDHGLAFKVPLVSKKLSGVLRKIALDKTSQNRFPPGGEYKKGNTKVYVGRTNPISKRNMYGTCSPEQLRARMLILARIVGRSPSLPDAKKYDGGLHTILRSWFGSWNKGKERLGFDIYKTGNKYDQTHLIAVLREWVVKNRKLPSAKMIEKDKTMPSCETYARQFGSWNRAKEISGLNQLLEEIK